MVEPAVNKSFDEEECCEDCLDCIYNSLYFSRFNPEAVCDGKSEKCEKYIESPYSFKSMERYR